MRGDSGFAQINQNGLDARGTVNQQAALAGNGGQSRNNGASIQQGQGLTGSDITNLFGAAGDSTADVPNVRADFNAGAGGVDTVDVTANITQSGRNNDTYIGQDGVNLIANVTQHGSAAGAGQAQFQSGGLRNLVVISQTGAVNTATAVQNVGVGPSGAASPASGNPAATNDDPGDDEFYHPGGARSAEIRILQQEFRNTAIARQSGLGQHARIEQSGDTNYAEITQGAGATNATAVIRQLGDDNAYQVTQTLPGQYIVVTQRGDGNVNVTTDTAGPAFGGGGSSQGPITLP
jgi:hypothetical protein